MFNDFTVKFFVLTFTLNHGAFAMRIVNEVVVEMHKQTA